MWDWIRSKSKESQSGPYRTSADIPMYNDSYKPLPSTSDVIKKSLISELDQIEKDMIMTAKLLEEMKLAAYEYSRILKGHQDRKQKIFVQLEGIK